MRFALVVSSRCHEGKDQEEQSRAYRAIGDQATRSTVSGEWLAKTAIFQPALVF